MTPITPPLQILDRLQRAEVPQIFCNGEQFIYELADAELTTTLQTLDQPQISDHHHLTPRRVVGVGKVNNSDSFAHYTLYNPANNQLEFQKVYFGTKKGFR